jgi:hypothetical protein
MQKFIDAEQVRSLLMEIKRQHILISIRDLSGNWTPEFYSIEPLEEMMSSLSPFLLIVKSPSTDRISIADLRTLTGLKLNKYLTMEDGLYSMFEIYKEQNLDYFKVPTESHNEIQ